MKKGFLLLLAMLFVPTLIVGFLYLFGENNFSAQNKRYKGLHLNNAGTLNTKTAGQVSIVALWPQAPTQQDCQLLDRLLYRLRVVKEKGPLVFVPVGPNGPAIGALCHGLALQEYGFVQNVPEGDSLTYTAVAKRIGVDAGNPGLRAAILTDKQGQVVNVYDLNREAILDTLVTEALITIESD